MKGVDSATATSLKGRPVARRNVIRKALSVVLPAGAFGASLVLALVSSTTDAAAASNQTATAQEEGIAARLQAIRTGVSEMTGSAGDLALPEGQAAPTWWGNGGWGRWHRGWGNGGWGRLGWGNGGWHNWHNWPNGGWGNGGWGNGGWGNGWHNFWHNG